MNDDKMRDRLGRQAPTPSREAMEEAWSAALGEFRRPGRSGSLPVRWVWPLAAAATIAILCAVIVAQWKSNRSSGGNPGSTAQLDLVQIFGQGRELFGDQLQAVTVSKDCVVWHLSDEITPGPATDQVVTVTLDQGGAPNLHIAVSPGAPVNVEQAGRILRIEFLPDASDQIMAVGDGIYWESGTPGSPMMDARLRELCLNP